MNATSIDSRFKVRPLDVLDVHAFKETRLKALREYPKYFLDNAEQASLRSDKEWTEYLIGDHKKVFGLFDHENLIGIASIYKPNTNDDCNTAHLAMGFIHTEFRGIGLSSLLYNARLNWAKSNSTIRILKISHRKENLVSAKAITKNGFQYISEKTEKYGDGTTGTSLKYKLDLRKVD